MIDHTKKQFAVLGLGRFGMSVAQTLAEHGVNILVCDSDPRRVQEASVFATQAVQMAIDDEASLDHIGIGNFDVVVIAVGREFEAALMATSVAKERGASFIIVKANSDRQQKILQSIGANRVIRPEWEMGEKVARRLVRPNMMDLFEDTGHFTISEMAPMEYWIGKTVAESNIRAEHGVNILAIRRANQVIIPVEATEIIADSDILVIMNQITKA